MIGLGVLLPLPILFPIQWVVFGVPVIPATAVAFLAGVVLVELEMADWGRIPFTCSYMPIKWFVGLTALIGFAAFVVFTSIGSRLADYSRTHAIGSVVVMAILGASSFGNGGDDERGSRDRRRCCSRIRCRPRSNRCGCQFTEALPRVALRCGQA